MPDTARLVVVNTTPLVALATVGQVELLRLSYTQILIPPAVHAEILAGGQSGIGIAELQRADWIQVTELRDPRRAELLLPISIEAKPKSLPWHKKLMPLWSSSTNVWPAGTPLA